MIYAENAGEMWTRVLNSILRYGEEVTARNQKTLELVNVNIKVKHTLKNIIVNKYRGLNYRFMVAEWLWIWYGHDDVATIAQYNKRIAEFSDDGETFAGAYGPKVRSRWPYVKDRLKSDRESRQAVIVIPGPQSYSGMTRDEPCTVSLQFLIRRDELHTIVTMRSSDAWLGLPYDFYNFSMLANILAAELNVNLGAISFNLGSSHLYDRNLEQARLCVNEADTQYLYSPTLPGPPPPWLQEVLKTKEPQGRMVFPWAHYDNILRAKTNERGQFLMETLSRVS